MQKKNHPLERMVYYANIILLIINNTLFIFLLQQLLRMNN